MCLTRAIDAHHVTHIFSRDANRSVIGRTVRARHIEWMPFRVEVEGNRRAVLVDLDAVANVVAVARLPRGPVELLNLHRLQHDARHTHLLTTRIVHAPDDDEALADGDALSNQHRLKINEAFSPLQVTELGTAPALPDRIRALVEFGQRCTALRISRVRPAGDARPDHMTPEAGNDRRRRPVVAHRGPRPCVHDIHVGHDRRVGRCVLVAPIRGEPRPFRRAVRGRQRPPISRGLHAQTRFRSLRTPSGRNDGDQSVDAGSETHQD